MSDVRMIDANALDFALVDEYITDNSLTAALTGKGRCIFNAAIDIARCRVADAETVDVVPVVRCRECEKFWEYTESHKATVEKADGDCMIRCMVAPDDPQFCAVQKNDYCSMGKRNGAKMDAKGD